MRKLKYQKYDFIFDKNNFTYGIVIDVKEKEIILLEANATSRIINKKHFEKLKYIGKISEEQVIEILTKPYVLFF
jgi:hypothetical protein